MLFQLKGNISSASLERKRESLDLMLSIFYIAHYWLSGPVARTRAKSGKCMPTSAWAGSGEIPESAFEANRLCLSM